MFCYKNVDGRKDEASLRAIYQLRYQVYVNECGFEKQEDHPSGLERDEYDQHSIHFYACPKDTGDAIGTIRIILGAETLLPVEKHFNIKKLSESIRRDQIAEISRLAVSKDYRCRALDRAIHATKQFTNNHPLTNEVINRFRRQFEQDLVRGLYVSLYRDSKARGLTHWFAVMTNGLHMILRRWGINFEQIGPSRDYHGLRTPYIINIENIEQSIQRNYPSMFLEAQNGLIYENAS
jgi:N-acyl amino acid synthase of PEP-CTERM/exosortase system